ncbi:unnamed protein product [Chrysodeixis includens]|uniref:Uncharacterized protein n=1 Tax=Chrysodeixis includens TaxID=689277 RepID=A0A9P0FWB7_CHRIL|nr:unnamed protein product [Chrysodeixis includens]
MSACMPGTSYVLNTVPAKVWHCARDVIITAERSAGWETHRVRLNRVPGYGFGIAVSGGRDNPHFASGDPSIAVSDVLRGGPAEDKLQVNDRIVSVNGVPLENVEYARAVQVLRDSGATVSLVVRRRAPAPPPTAPTTIKLSLTRNGKKEDFGLVLGCKLYVKELTMRAREQLNQGGQGLCEGDMVTRINNTPVTDAMTLKEARKLIESCKDRLNLVVTRELIREETVTNGNYQNNYNSLEASPLNVYGAAEASPGYSSSGQNLYVAAPVRGGDARRGPMSHEQLDQPPRPPPPRNEDYYSSRRQLYEEEAMNNQRNKPSSEPRLISFQKEGSVGLRLCGGNRSGVFVSGVQPTSPAALQGLQPADKILKFCALEQVNDMEMKGVTREEAVLFLLSLQDRIDLIVQHAPDDYNAVASGQMPGDSFHIKTHFHYTEPTDGEMSFRCGDVFHVVDTLHNGTVGAWQVYRIGRNNQEVQKGTIPNKARAEELATAQFNATKKEMSGNDGKHNFFRRRRSTHRRSKSLGKEHWDEVVLSDSISKFPAYERVVLKQPGFVRPVIVLGAVADIARERLLTESPDKFSSPKMDSTLEDTKTKSTGIIRLSSIRTVMERGKHALLDITPNAVDRLNYAQFYPIVIFLKADNKHIIKQLRAGLPKSAHKSSKKLLEQCQHMERVWGHVFTHTITLSEANQNTWFSKLIDLIQRTQQQQLWVSETKMAALVKNSNKIDQKCAGCKQELTTNEHLICLFCNYGYDLECANVPRDFFKKSMTLDQKKSWKCHDCRCKMPKLDNTNTPIRANPMIMQQVLTPCEENNITIRKQSSQPKNYDTSFEDLSLLGDTQQITEKPPSNCIQTELTLQNLSEMIMIKLKENNESIISDLRSTIQIEINKAISKLTEDFELKTTYLSKQNDQRKQELEKVNTKIENLTKENEKLKQEILELKYISPPPGLQCMENNLKKIVIYGLAEHPKEPEPILHDRLIAMFRDILQVDLTGYIEDMYRVGKNSARTRPLVIELISKRMVKYLLNNSHYFQNTRISLSEYLDENARKEREQLREEMMKARKKGLYAVIRNNQLYIEGKVIVNNRENNKNEKHDTLNRTQNEENNVYKNQPNKSSHDMFTDNHSFRNSTDITSQRHTAGVREEVAASASYSKTTSSILSETISLVCL